MAFRIKFNLNSVINGITSKLTSIVPTNLSQLGSLAKNGLVKNALNQVRSQVESAINNAVGFNIAGKIGALGSSLSDLSVSSVFGLASTAIVDQFKAVTGKYTDVIKNIQQSDFNVANLVTNQVTNMQTQISEELQSGIIMGKSSLESIASITNMSNTVIRDLSFDDIKKNKFIGDLTDKQLNRMNELITNAVDEANIIAADAINIEKIQQPPVVDQVIGEFNKGTLKEYKETLANTDLNSDIIKKANININGRNKKEISAVNKILQVEDVDKPSPMKISEIEDIPSNGYPERFLTYKDYNNLRYSDVYGGYDPVMVKKIFVKSRFSLQDKRYPEISGTLEQYILDLSAAGELELLDWHMQFI